MTYVQNFPKSVYAYRGLSLKQFEHTMKFSKIVEMTIDENSYGEFLFVHLERNDEHRTFYGLGFNYNRGRWIKNIPDSYSSSAPSQFYKPHNPDWTRKQWLEFYNDRKNYVLPQVDEKQTRENLAYEFLADIMDEDGAIIELEDHPYIYDLFGDE